MGWGVWGGVGGEGSLPFLHCLIRTSPATLGDQTEFGPVDPLSILVHGKKAGEGLLYIYRTEKETVITGPESYIYIATNHTVVGPKYLLFPNSD